MKEGTSAVLLQSGLGNERWLDSMECYYYLDLLSDGKTPYEGWFGMLYYGPLIPYGAMVEYHSISAKDQSGLHQFGAKVLPGTFFSVMHFARGESGKEIFWSQTLKTWSRWTHQNSTPEGTMQTEC